jgi:hypothetical protein
MGVCVYIVWTSVYFVCAQVVCAGSVEFVCFFESRKVRMVCRTFRNRFVEHWICQTYRNVFLSNTTHLRPREGQTRLRRRLPRLKNHQHWRSFGRTLLIPPGGQIRSNLGEHLYAGARFPPFLRGRSPLRIYSQSNSSSVSDSSRAIPRARLLYPPQAQLPSHFPTSKYMSSKSTVNNQPVICPLIANIAL